MSLTLQYIYGRSDEGSDEAECRRNVVSGRKFAGAIKFLVNARDLQLECARVLHETLLVPILMYDSETV